MKKIITMLIAAAFTFTSYSQNVAINTDGTVATDPTSMLEIKKAILAKVRIRSLGISDTSMLEFSNLHSNNVTGTSIRMTMNREQGLLFSSASDVGTLTQDSMFAMRFNSGRTYFGMNVKTPTSVLHLHDQTGGITTLRLTNSTTGVVGTQGISLALNGTTASLVNAEAGNLNFGTNSFVWGGFTSTGNFGLGTFTATERLDVAGNINMTTSKGIILDAQDRPLITRGFDQFTSGNYNGLGRWGLFMEPSSLTLGIPDVAGKQFEFAKYSTNSARTGLLTITRDGELNTPATNTANLLPVAYGNVAADGTILNGTGNFTVAVVSTRTYDITLTGIPLSASNSTSLLTITTDGQGTQGCWLWHVAGKMRVHISTNTEVYARNFSFMIYMP